MSASRQGLALALLAFAGFWAGSWQLPLFDLDEGAFSQATLEMLASGNYLTTTLDGAPRYDKPMLSYWLQGLSVSLLGVNEFAFRLPSMLCASLWMWLLFDFVRRRAAAPQAPWLAAGSLALSLMPGVIGHAATADALLNLLIAACLLDIWRYFELREQGGSPSRARRLVWRVYLWMGLGVLAKGPVAVVIPLAASLVFALGAGRGRDWLQAACDWRGWLVALGVVLPWGVACWLADDGEFIRRFLLDHNLERYQNTLQDHGGQPWYYLVALPLIVAPFTALLPGALWRGLAGDALDRYCLIGFCVVLLIFSFSRTQLPHYLLYGATPLLVLFGRNATRLPAKPWLLAPAVVLLLLFTALPWLLERVETRPQRAWEAGILGEALAAFDWRYSLLCALALAALAGSARLRPVPALLGAAGALSLVTWLGVVPVLAQAQQAPTREAARIARALQRPAVSYATDLPTFSVYRGAPTPRRLPEPGELVFLRADKLPKLRAALDAERLQPIYRRGGVALLQYGEPPPAGTDHLALDQRP